MTVRIGLDECLVCGSVGDARNLLDGLVRRCEVCTFAWTAQELPASEALYADSYFAGDGYADYWQPGIRRYEAGLRLPWLLKTGKVRTLLEVGSAGGFFVETARAAGIDARGIEVSSAAVDYARNTLNMPIHQGTFESTEFRAEFDAVCAYHVLEHVEDPVDFIVRAREALVENGRIALEVPNFASAGAQRLGQDWPSIELRYHRWHFTPQSLIRLVTKNGFDVVVSDTVFSRFYWPPLRRLRRARAFLLTDMAASHSPRVSHPSMGDHLRLVARRRDPVA